MATTTMSRPLTPFPHTHTLTHGSQASYFHHIQFEAQPHSYGYTAQPIHFHLKKPISTPTPPSLIRKGSSSSRYITSPTLPAQPELVQPTPRRTPSSSSSSTYSPLMPATPILESPVAPPSTPTPLSLPPSMAEITAKPVVPTLDLEEKLIESEYNDRFSYSPYSISLSTGETIASSSSYTSSGLAKRPKLKRRDTPIPHPHLSQLATLHMSTSKGEQEGSRKVLRSIIDGGNWIIVD
ncbi:hypothetical protein I302_105954 [Kwoniella bestiolae CBS 10118]|uniref:Uncharacterized protein n=1 Tax=Kwoniella bestiolae CBS 10118 TaxID=1296100 RepID=A0A1B9G2L6_9TREE|nr:hypothetical protein I302_05078 [Kwoniella bestiolae CBS 10118]OCF25264.1 hypothetical protein I302_05078 [Kwoniella bestiolae CBS 10118]